MRDPKRIAVILIHGVGEQLPMETLRSFADITWKQYSAQFEGGNTLSPEIWSKPDYFGDTFETRRLSTSENNRDERVDFFEFYWAHLMAETKTARVVEWLKSLLLRNPFTVPESIRAAHRFLLVATLLLASSIIALKSGLDRLEGDHPWLFALLTAALGGVWAWFAAQVHDVAGDAARYLHHSPKNVTTRHEIRKRGVGLLENVIKSRRNYGRVIVVGHSLGSVIGYDILSQTFARLKRRVPASMLGEELDRAVERILECPPTVDPNRLDLDPAIARYFDLQQKWSEAISQEWPVTDFVTLGSPLAHADSLVESSRVDFDERVALREFPVCPPVLERDRSSKRLGAPIIAYSEDGMTRLHHGAVFLPTRWSNFYFTHRQPLLGDPIGGNVSRLFGSGVRDYPLSWSFSVRRMGHTSYWFDGRSEAVAHLRTVLWGKPLSGSSSGVSRTPKQELASTT